MSEVPATNPPASEAPPGSSPSWSPPPTRFRRWLPTALGLIVAVGAVGFVLSGFEIQIRPKGATSEGADPLALLGDDVATIQADLGDLSKDIGTNLEALGTSLDGAAEERHTEQSVAAKALAARVARLEAALAKQSREGEGLRRELVALRRSLESAQLRAAGKATPEASGAKASELDSGPSAASPPDPAAQPLAAAPAETPPPAATPEAEPAAPAAPKRRRRGLFSFKMKGGGPDFAQRQRYRVISSLSRVGFDAKSTLHDFSGVTSSVEGSFVGRLDADDKVAVGQIRAAVAELRTGVDGRDEELRKVLAAEKHAWIQFDLKSLKVSKSDPAARTSSAIGRGTFSIRGVTKEVSIPLEISVDRSKRLVVAGEASLDLREFQVEIPSVGAIGMEPTVKVWLSLRLRSLGKAQGTPAKAGK